MLGNNVINPTLVLSANEVDDVPKAGTLAAGGVIDVFNENFVALVALEFKADELPPT